MKSLQAGIRQRILIYDTKSMNNQKQNQQIELYQNEKFCSSKNTNKKIKIFTNHISDKALESRIYK